MKKSSVVHFEMPAKDRKRVSDFYSKAFGWNMKQLGEEMGGYVLAGTAETDEHNMVKTPGAINGGFFDYKNEEGFNAPHVVIAVEDINESIKNVEEAGGEVLPSLNGTGKTAEIPGIGTYVSFKDTEGNMVGMLQPSNM